MYKLNKALYGLKQALSACYEGLNTFLLRKSFEKGFVKAILVIKKFDYDILIVQIYVDDILFGSTNFLCEYFSKMICREFEMRLMGELTYFLSFSVRKTLFELFQIH